MGEGKRVEFYQDGMMQQGYATKGGQFKTRMVKAWSGPWGPRMCAHHVKVWCADHGVRPVFKRRVSA